MIEVFFFGRIADVAGARSQTYAGVTTSLYALRDEIFAAALADGRLDRAALRMSVNRQQVRDDRVIAPGDEVAFFPVFSGG
ncbi:MoaD/ThiS family protein [Asticcacaulis sp. EMRT-3]|uniref:MoaD/ThiS family protein n=1 Tax=Asticcacaulis sp. EMRT-3 TaxID=3040349 RepID=UPI0024AF1C11|nr:MoaD/ThiS family protein [Asticcacaulis sp. EMRT-3]MDI7773945.1 MoaD/ThiS family protein [Asticcacaulis sp. EMRT-3]